MWFSILFSIFLIVVAAVLSAVQVRTWRSARRRELNDRDRRFVDRQFRRRIQIDVMIGVVGVAVLGESWVAGPVAKAIYWSGMLLIGVWIMLLALADIASSRIHLQRLHREHVADFAALRADLRRICAAQEENAQQAEPDAAEDDKTN